MHLEGQRTRAACTSEQAGFALAAMLVAIAILSVMLLVALPTWRHQVTREKEAELIFRGEQYARAIGLYQRKAAGAFPASLDMLVEQKHLRKKYKDPITGDDFVPIYANSPEGMQALQQGAGRGGPPPPPGAGAEAGQLRFEVQRSPGRIEARPVLGAQSALAGSAGGIVGVTSKSKAQSIRLYNGRDRYDQWVFVYVAASPQAGPPSATQPESGLPTRSPGGGQ